MKRHKIASTPDQVILEFKDGKEFVFYIANDSLPYFVAERLWGLDGDDLALKQIAALAADEAVTVEYLRAIPLGVKDMKEAHSVLFPRVEEDEKKTDLPTTTTLSPGSADTD